MSWMFIKVPIFFLTVLYIYLDTLPILHVNKDVQQKSVRLSSFGASSNKPGSSMPHYITGLHSSSSCMDMDIEVDVPRCDVM